MKQDNSTIRLTKKEIQQMIEQFDFIDFFETKEQIAVIVITPWDIIIIKSRFIVGKYATHQDILNDVLVYMDLLNRPKYRLWAFRLSSGGGDPLHPNKLVSFTDYPDGFFKKNCEEYDIVLTEEMINVIEQIYEIVSNLPYQNNDDDFVRDSWKDIKFNYHLDPTENKEYIEETELIGIPINEFLDKLKRYNIELKQRLKKYQNDSIIPLDR